MTTAARIPSRVGAIMRYLLLLCVALGIAAIFLLAFASANTAMFSEYYPMLLGINLATALLLAGMVTYQLISLRRRLKAGVFGAKLTVRLVILFALMAMLPGALIYGVSVQFVSKSIESWFDVRLDGALESGLTLGRGALDGRLNELATKADKLGMTLSTQPTSEHAAALRRLREEAGIEEATLFSMQGKVLAFSGNEHKGIVPDAPSAAAMRLIRQQQTYSVIEAIPGRGLYLRALTPVNAVSLTEESRVLQLLQVVPPQLAKDAEIVQTGYREYQELQLSRRGLKRLYAITLTLTLLLALLSSLGLAFVLSDRLSAPLSALVEGTRAVAQGDFSRRAAVASSDELGLLTQSFNSMTLQLAEAQARVERNQAQLAHANTYLESVLAHLSAGVLTFDGRLHLRSANPIASQLLRVDCSTLVDRGVQDWAATEPALASLAKDIVDVICLPDAPEWERQVERELKDGTQVLLLRGTRFGVGTDAGLIVVFDDITHLLQAQRDAAWAEVARRLAHEIRNPLTPIQLSAERLQLKLESKLSSTDAEILVRSTQTIVSQVTALKRMVDSFSQYARTPEPMLHALDLNGLIREVLVLYESLGPAIVVNLAADLPPTQGDAMLIRQVVHNLLQNAQDALAGNAAPRIEIATVLRDGRVELAVTDNGTGFPEHLIKRAFEPYVTTKPRGTGLGLSIVRKIVEEHYGEVTLSNVAPHGARVTIVLPVVTEAASARSVA